MTTVPDSISLVDLSKLWIQKALEEIAAQNETDQPECVEQETEEE
jgi:hypothetical protein